MYMNYGTFNLLDCFKYDFFKSNYSLTIIYRKNKIIDAIVITDFKLKKNYFYNKHLYLSYNSKIKNNYFGPNDNLSVGLYKNILIKIPLNKEQFKKLIELNFSDKNINFLFKYNLEEWMI